MRTAGAMVTLLIVLVACDGDAAPGGGADDPMAEHLDEATAVASEEWDAPWVLDLASARYSPDGEGLVLEDRAYVFVSDDGATTYYLVRFHADGTVSSGPVAGMAQRRVESFDFGDNEITSVDALDSAWDLLGETLVERCGPLRWLNVNGSQDGEGRQWWSVEYRIGGDTHTIWIDAVSGAVIDIDEEPC